MRTRVAANGAAPRRAAGPSSSPVFLRPEHDVGLFADRTRHATLHVAETVH